MDKNRILEILIAKAETEFRGDIGLIVDYGEAGASQRYYYVPRTERGWTFGSTFLIKGTAVLLEAMSAADLLQCCKGDRRDVVKLLGGQIVYAYGEEERDGFAQMKEKAAQSIDKEKYLKAIMLRCKELYFSFYEEGKDMAMLAADLLERVSYALLLWNDSYLQGGCASMKEEVLALPVVPDCYAECAAAITQTADPQILKRLCRELITQTNEFVSSFEEEPQQKLPAKTVYSGLYEEAKVLYQNIIEACFSAKAESALLYAKQLQTMLDQAAEKSQQVPQLKNLLDLYYRKDLVSFAVSIYSHEASLIGFLLNQEIPFTQYANIERFEEAMLSE